MTVYTKWHVSVKTDLFWAKFSVAQSNPGVRYAACSFSNIFLNLAFVKSRELRITAFERSLGERGFVMLLRCGFISSQQFPNTSQKKQDTWGLLVKPVKTTNL